MSLDKKGQAGLVIKLVGAGVGSVGLYLVAIGKNVLGGVLIGSGGIIMALGGLIK